MTATPANAMAESSWRGYVSPTQDALILFEAAKRGHIPKITRRLREDERKALIRSGSVFIFEEKESGIKRWTDGLLWSPSRILQNFLIYREMDRKGKRSALSGSGSNSAPKSGMAAGAPRMVPNPQYEDARAATPASTAEPSPQAIRAGSEQTGSQDSGKASPTSAADATTPTSSSAPMSRRTSEMHRSLVGSLSGTFPFIEDGLVKKTIAIELENAVHHLISYYKLEDVYAGRLSTPASKTELRALAISPEFLQKANFRAPPIIEIDPDGVPRYRGEPEDAKEATPVPVVMSVPASALLPPAPMTPPVPLESQDTPAPANAPFATNAAGAGAGALPDAPASLSAATVVVYAFGSAHQSTYAYPSTSSPVVHTQMPMMTSSASLPGFTRDGSAPSTSAYWQGRARAASAASTSSAGRRTGSVQPTHYAANSSPPVMAHQIGGSGWLPLTNGTTSTYPEHDQAARPALPDEYEQYGVTEGDLSSFLPLTDFTPAEPPLPVRMPPRFHPYAPMRSPQRHATAPHAPCPHPASSQYSHPSSSHAQAPYLPSMPMQLLPGATSAPQYLPSANSSFTSMSPFDGDADLNMSGFFGGELHGSEGARPITSMSEPPAYHPSDAQQYDTRNIATAPGPSWPRQANMHDGTGTGVATWH